MFGGKKRIYADWASAAPVRSAAQRAFDRALHIYGNPGAPHAEGKAAKDALEEARATVARLAGTKPERVVFTSGATEANNVALQGVTIAARARGVAKPHVLYLPSSHSSVVNTLSVLSSFGADVETIAVAGGTINLEQLAQQLRPETVLVSVDAVCGETGIRFNTRDVRRLLDKAASQALLHVDASQLPLAEAFEHTRLGADLIVLDAQKVGGVRGVGALIVPKPISLAPITHGGGQEEGLRPGTEPVALICAFATALADIDHARSVFARRAKGMREHIVSTIAGAIPDVVVNEGKENVPHILNLSFPGRDTDYAVMLLDAKGFAVSTKSTCETDSSEGSRAVLAYTGDDVRARSTLRLSWGPETKDEELKQLARAVIDTIRFLDANTLY